VQVKVLSKNSRQSAVGSPQLIIRKECFILFVQIFLFIFLMGLSFVINAQQLILQGKITFERKENMHKLIDDEMADDKDPSPWYSEIRKTAPKYRTDLFELSFNSKQTLYQLVTEDDIPFNQHWYRVAYNNKVLTNLEQRSFTTEKTVYEKEYRVTDSLPQIQWKLTNEFREIAGKNCRKATTILFDSVYIIAFYTDEIPVSGGPENFQGLPGMILGIVVPRIHYTYFATNIQNQLIPEKDMQLAPAKRKAQQVNIAGFTKEMLSAFTDWGNSAIKVYWRTMF
jgi:GLPGLI family protein